MGSQVMEPTSTDMMGYGLYAVAYGTSILAFLMTKINWLRVLFVVSSGCYALYYFIFPVEPLWLDVISEGAFVLVNVVMLSYVFWVSRRIKFTEPEQFLYKSCFESLDAHEFKKILSIAEWQVREPSAVLIKKDQHCEFLYCLFNGAVEIQGDSVIKSRRTGSVLGELSYRLESTASATVLVKETCVLLAITQTKLRKLCKKNERISNAVDALLSSQMAIKLVEDRS